MNEKSVRRRRDLERIIQLLKQEVDRYGAAEALLELSRGDRVLVEKTCKEIVDYLVSQIEIQERTSQKNNLSLIDSKPHSSCDVKTFVKVQYQTDAVFESSEASTSEAFSKVFSSIEKVEQKYGSSKQSTRDLLVKNVPTPMFVNNKVHCKESKYNQTDFKLVTSKLSQTVDYSTEVKNSETQSITVKTKECEVQTVILKKDVSIQTDATTTAEKECQKDYPKTVSAEVQVDIQSYSLVLGETKSSSPEKKVRYPNVDPRISIRSSHEQLLPIMFEDRTRKDRGITELTETFRQLQESESPRLPFYKFATKQEDEMRMAQVERSNKQLLRQRCATGYPIGGIPTNNSYALNRSLEKGPDFSGCHPHHKQKNHLSDETLNMNLPRSEKKVNLKVIEQISRKADTPFTKNEISSSPCCKTHVTQALKKRGKRKLLDNQKLTAELKKKKVLPMTVKDEIQESREVQQTEQESSKYSKVQK